MDIRYTDELVTFLNALDASTLPPEVVDRSRYFLLDYLGVAIRGSREDSARAAQRMVQRLNAPGPAIVFGTGLRALPGLAAFANGTASHSVELDDTHSGGSIHLGAVMYSVALALNQSEQGIDAGLLHAAVVAGYEMAARVSMAAQPAAQYALGFHPTSTAGVFGATVTAAKLLKLTRDQMSNAVGIAGSMSAGSMEFLAEGAWTKRIHPGLAAQNGIQAAMLAAEGFVGPKRILEGRDGYLNGYSRNPKAERLTAGFGETFEMLQTAVKPHACCRYMQGPIDAVLDIVRTEALSPDRIGSIAVAVLKAGWGLVAEPALKKYQPETVVDAQFSMPFGAAVAVVRGAAGLGEFTLDQVRSPEIRQMMAKVRLVQDERIEATFPREWPANVLIETTAGQRHERFVRFPRGDPENPLTWDEMIAKFRSLAGAVISAEACDAVVDAVRCDRLLDIGASLKA